MFKRKNGYQRDTKIGIKLGKCKGSYTGEEEARMQEMEKKYERGR